MCESGLRGISPPPPTLESTLGVFFICWEVFFLFLFILRNKNDDSFRRVTGVLRLKVMRFLGHSVKVH